MTEARDALEQTKKDIVDRFLGKGGIHGVGIRQREGYVRLYVDGTPEPSSEAVIDEIRRAHPGVDIRPEYTARARLKD